MRAVREALRAFQRAPLLSALGVMTIALSLFAFGLFGLVALNLRAALDAVEERVEVRAFLLPTADAAVAAPIVADLTASPEVASATYVSPDSALARARRELQEFDDVFEAGVLPGSIELHLKPGFRGPREVARLAERLRAYPGVEEVRYGEEWVQKLYRLRTVAGVAGAGLGAAFALVAIMIIGSTIRMAVLSRAREIAIMRLVGATAGFVRRPFLIEGFLKGALGGAVALALTWVASVVVSRNFVATQFFRPDQAALGVAAGALLGLLGSAASVSRHLRKV
ncbi:MAG: Assymetric_cell_division_FstX [uncultured Gemmatimonadaceae bacterium]|uniref:Cell division protein FtsX n=1 Tax=uncultured Gemmatimonadaceae bacterium TaxID=246130 RepID=A0A6J4M9J5_9BACT|nr:MAG: Assymetric_cell_division_FstX [uncultured Gemmatimonadaceae bacterium]